MAQHTYTVTAGDGYWPEMGGAHDGSAIFVIRFGDYLSWQPERHTEALATFKRLRIRPRHMDLGPTVQGGEKWTAHVTWEGAQKLKQAKAAVSEHLLD